MPYADPIKRKEYHRAYGKAYVEVNRVRHNERTRVNMAAARKRDPERFKLIEKKRWRPGAVKTMFRHAKLRAKQKGMAFDITIEDIVVPECCPLLGMRLRVVDGSREWDSPTLDRVDNAKGYVRGNVWVISWRANRLKSDATAEELMNIATRLRDALGGNHRRLR